jgi:hypothetical protein
MAPTPLTLADTLGVYNAQSKMQVRRFHQSG